MYRCVRLLLALALSLDPLLGSCQIGRPAFQWEFRNIDDPSISTLIQCKDYPIKVSSRTDNSSEVGRPPYYLIAFRASGISTTSLIGFDPNNLSWKVDQPSTAEKSLLISVVDADGNYGGQPATIYSIADGDSGCLPLQPEGNENFELKSNVSNSISTCDSMRLQVYGGRKPYNITFVAPDSMVLTNVTLGQTDDVYFYVDRASPNGKLMAAVVDADGVWGVSSQIVSTTGAAVTSNSCPGQASGSGNSSSTPTSLKSAKARSKKIVIPVAITVITIVLIFAAAFVAWMQRKGTHRKTGQDLQPEPWQGPPIHEHALASKNRTPYDQYSMSKLDQNRDSARAVSPPNTGMLGDANRSVQSSGELAAAPIAHGTMYQLSSHRGTLSAPNSSGNALPVSSDQIPPIFSSEMITEPDIIIQHRDGGAVQEIPPPYIDPATTEAPRNAALNSDDGNVNMIKP